MKYIRCFLLLFFFPFLGHAQVVITEVMYDAAGTDTGYEWVEIYNEGDTNIDIAQWFFYENNV